MRRTPSHAARSARLLVLLWLAYVSSVWLIAAYVAAHVPSHRVPAPPAVATAPLSAWDGSNYNDIAVHGYSAAPDEARRFAFFPLLPAVSRLLGGTRHAALAGIVLSQLLLLGSMLLLREWRATGDAVLRAEPGFWLLVAPLAFFHAAFYAESLYLFLLLGGLVLHRRGHNAYAICALFLAGLARPTAILIPALFIPALLKPETRRSALLLAAAPLAGIAVYTLYVAALTGSLFGYSRLQAELWHHGWTVPFLPALQELMRVTTLALDGVLPPRDLLIRPLVLVGVVTVLAAGWRRLEPGLRVFAIVSLLFVHSQVPSLSSARYDMAIFPAYVALAGMPFVRTRSGVLLAVALVIVQLAFMLDFMVWRWAG
ncbi:MAG TPA: hypothetical protein VK912_04170 [Longimicrobiales bacterium]|nr:hypothetical protein [Longimicrobiales bacterium]